MMLGRDSSVSIHPGQRSDSSVAIPPLVPLNVLTSALKNTAYGNSVRMECQGDVDVRPER